eukprot:1157652-Pelagomonas_calceolata.AAC.17
MHRHRQGAQTPVNRRGEAQARTRSTKVSFLSFMVGTSTRERHPAHRGALWERGCQGAWPSLLDVLAIHWTGTSSIF